MAKARDLLLLLTWSAGVLFLGGAEERVVLQLRWDRQFQFAGYYAAQWQGYYREAGLTVEIRSAISPDGSLRSAITEVAEGRADFGVGAADILTARDRGHPLVVVASVFQQSAVAFFAPERIGLQKPADLVDLRVSRRLGDMVDVEMQAMLKAEGIDPENVEPYPFDQSEGYLAAILADRIDVIPGYVIGTPHEFIELGVALNSLRPADYGVDFYGDSLFAREETVSGRTEMTRAFVDASLRGWEYALEHSEKIADRIIREYEPRFPIADFASFVHYQIDPVRHLTLYPIVELGNMNPARWRRMHETLEEMGMVEGAFDPDVAIFDPDLLERRRLDRFRRWAGTAIGVSLLAVAVGVLWLISLRRTVQVRTGALRREQHALMEANLRQRQAVRAGDVGLWDWDLVDDTVFYSTEWKNQIGYEEHEIGESLEEWRSRVHPDDLAPTLTAIETAIQNGAAEHQVEFRFRHKDGTYRWILARASVASDENGRPIRMVGSHVDITDQKRRADERARMEQEIHRAQRLESVGRLASGVAHDLNNLLTPILGYAELLLEDCRGDESRTGPLEVIMNTATRARDLVSQLLAFSRKQALQFRTIDLNAMLRDLQPLVRRSIREDVAIELSLAPDPPPVKGDQGQLEQVVMNLVLNAQDAMPTGGTLTVSTATGRPPITDLTEVAEPPSEDCVVMCFRDTGCGIDKETLQHIFEPFFTTKERGKGTGLGLSSVYGIIKQHQGCVHVDSVPGRGSSFEVYLPASRDAMGSEEEATGKPETHYGHASETVLLVEDNEYVRNLARSILSKEGYVVLSAGSARETLTLLESHGAPIHLLVTDVIMPEQNGKDLYERVAALRPGIRVLYMSGYTDEVIAPHGVTAPGIHLIQKPFSGSALAAKVRQVLDEAPKA